MGLSRVSILLPSFVPLFGSAAMCVLAVGCGSGKNIVPLEGRVEFSDGEPLTSGSIMFQPPSGQPARAQIQSDGTFVLSTEEVGDGAVVGLNKVRISSYATKAETADAPEMLGESLIDERFSDYATSGLTVNVKAEGNEPVVLTVERPSSDGD